MVGVFGILSGGMFLLTVPATLIFGAVAWFVKNEVGGLVGTVTFGIIGLEVGLLKNWNF